MAKVTLNVNEYYGDNEVTLDFPPKWEVKEVLMEGHNAKPMTQAEIEEAFQHPEGTPTLQELARGKHGRICITVEDLMRPCPSYAVLPAVVEELRKGGVADSQIFILSALGTHRPMSTDEFARKCGWGIVRKYNVVNHNVFENFDNFLCTSFGTPLEINAEFARADLRICVYAIIKHGMSGTTGSGKEVIPGVSSIRTIAYNHGVVLQKAHMGIWRIKDNLLRQDMQEAARKVDVNFTVNMVINNRRELVGLHVGDLDEAWHAAIRDSYRLHQSPIPSEKADVVLVNSYPRGQGIEWWGAGSSLKEGGTAIAYHDSETGCQAFHYLGERDQYTRRLAGYRGREGSWPVKNAARAIVVDPRYSCRDALTLSPKVQWVTGWKEALKTLQAIHGEEATVHIYPYGPVQFDPSDSPLLLP